MSHPVELQNVSEVEDMIHTNLKKPRISPNHCINLSTQKKLNAFSKSKNSPKYQSIDEQ